MIGAKKTQQALGYVVFVNRACEPTGPSHAVVNHDANKPILACGEDSGPLNWTLNLKAPTPICHRCATRTTAPVLPTTTLKDIHP